MKVVCTKCEVEVCSKTCSLVREFEYDMSNIDASDIALEDFKRRFPNESPQSITVVKTRRYSL